MAKTVPGLDKNPAANKLIIDMMREGIKRDRERRDFFQTYFNEYKSTNNGDMTAAWDRYRNSPEGSILTRDDAGNMVPNKNRMSWKKFFQKERGGGSDVPVERDKGGPIRLGSEYD